MNYTKDEIATHLDLAVLKPTATQDDVKTACTLAHRHKIASVCVPLVYTPLACSLFNNVSTVIGFPHGNTAPSIKMLEAEIALRYGVKELDAVVNYGRFLDGDVAIVTEEIANLVGLTYQYNALLKIIFETCYYTTSQLQHLCRICIQLNVPFIKTSTGYAAQGATPETVKLMCEMTEATGTLVKASGGIKTYQDACMYLDLGCKRLGAGNFFRLLPQKSNLGPFSSVDGVLS